MLTRTCQALLFLLLLVLSVDGYAQQPPPDYLTLPCDPLSASGAPPVNTYARYLSIQNGAVPLNEGEDYIGFIDSDGYVIGVEGVVINSDGPSIGCTFTSRGFTTATMSGNTTWFQYPQGSPLVTCPPDFGAVVGEEVTALLYDFASQTYYEITNESIVYGNYLGGFITPPGGNFCYTANATQVSAPFRFLPITLDRFSGRALDDATVRLDWTSASETGSSHFVVERSHNNQQWEELGRVTAAGESTTEARYDFLDRKPHAGVNFYRLRMVDLDGTTENSPIVIVELDDIGDRFLSTFPNPARAGDRISVRLAGKWSDAPITAALYDASGRHLAAYNGFTPGSTAIRLPAGIDAGLYTLRVMQGSTTIAHRIALR